MIGLTISIGDVVMDVYVPYIESSVHSIINHTVQDVVQKLSGWYIIVFVTCMHACMLRLNIIYSSIPSFIYLSSIYHIQV